MLKHQVYLIGSRYKHHSQHSGYEGFGRYVGTPLNPPVTFGAMTSYWGWRMDVAIASFACRPFYTLAALLTELSVFFRMIGKRKKIFHAIYGDTDLWLLPKISSLTGNRLVATFHQPASTLEFMAIDNRIVNNLRAVILVAETQRNFFEKLISSERIFVVPHGIDTQFFQPVSELTSQPICITVGSHLRDFNTLKQSMNLIWQTNPNMRLIAIGTRRSKDPNQQFKSNDQRITFLDNVSDTELRQAYQKARLAIFAFHDATASNGLLEALSCGVPIVATNVGGVSEYVDSATGVLGKPGDPKDLADGVLQLLHDPVLVGRLSRACRLRAVNFDYRTVAKKMSDLYAGILNCD